MKSVTGIQGYIRGDRPSEQNGVLYESEHKLKIAREDWSAHLWDNSNNMPPRRSGEFTYIYITFVSRVQQTQRISLLTLAIESYFPLHRIIVPQKERMHRRLSTTTRTTEDKSQSISTS